MASISIWDRLKSEGLTASAIFPAAIEALLSSLQINENASPPTVTLSVQQKPLGILDLDLTPPGPEPRQFVLTFEGVSPAIATHFGSASS